MSGNYISPLVEQARGLSSGTLSVLTGYTKYAEVDPVYVDFIEFCEENVDHFFTWQSAWREYAKLKGYEIR